MTTGPEWGNGYTYDGWGNLTAKTVTKGSAPAWSNAVDAATNRLVGMPYDAGGNLGWAEHYDSWNRLAPMMNFFYYLRPQNLYDASNKRVARYLNTSYEEICFYGIDGRKLETFRRTVGYSYVDQPRQDVYFAGTQIIAESRRVITDRLGSVRGDITAQRYNYYPYGEERGSTPNGVTKFGTYFRDSGGTDYADQRYYANNQGRFLTPDPYRASGGPADPGSWNRYAYVQGDPVNANDPTGLKLNFLVCGAAGDPYGGVDGCGGGGHVSAFPTSIRGPEGPVGGTLTYVAFPDMYGGEPVESKPTNWQLMGPAFARALQALTLNRDCFNLFGSEESRDEEWDPTVVLTSMVISRDGTYGSVNFDYTGNGAALNKPSGFLTPSIRDGLRGSSATVSLNSSYWNVGNVDYNAETLLHELGHVYNFTRGSGNFAIGNRAELSDSEAFDKLIKQKCKL